MIDRDVGAAVEGGVSHRVRSALAALPAVQRDILELAVHGRRSYSEIALLVGAPRAVVMTRAHEGMLSLQAALGHDPRTTPRG